MIANCANMREAKLLDCHTHSAIDAPHAIRSLAYEEWSHGVLTDTSQLYAIGVHPWSLPERGSITEIIDQMTSLLESTPQIVAIGECGVDKVRSTGSPAEQLIWLEAQMRLACQRQLPIVLHCVRAWGEMMAVRGKMAREFRSLPPMVLHGFRAKGEVAKMLLNAGFLLSFGRHYDEMSAQQAYEAEALLIETDELLEGATHQETLQMTYSHLAQTLGITLAELTARVEATTFWRAVDMLRPVDSE